MMSVPQSYGHMSATFDDKTASWLVLIAKDCAPEIMEPYKDDASHILRLPLQWRWTNQHGPGHPTNGSHDGEALIQPLWRNIG